MKILSYSTFLFVALLAIVFSACGKKTDDGTNDSQSPNVSSENSKNGIRTIVEGDGAPISINEEVNVDILSVSENRYAQLIKSADFFDQGGATTVRIRLKGEAAGKATKIGDLKIASAVDDQGESMVLEKRNRFGGSTMSLINRDPKFGGNTSPDELEYDIPLKQSKRSATQINSLKGELSLNISRIAKIEIPAAELEKLVGKKVENDALKKAGVSIEITGVNSRGSLVSMKVEDKDEMLLATDLHGADGKKINTGFSSGGFGATMNRSLFGTGNLPENSKLVISVDAERKLIKVPFSFEKIVLP